MDKRPSSTKLRRECFDRNRKADETGRIYLECYICHGRIYPGRELWEAEHPTPFANGGRETLPAHQRCHAPKTARDISAMAKGKRAADFHFGIKRATGSFRNSRLRKKVSGEVVER